MYAVHGVNLVIEAIAPNQDAAVIVLSAANTADPLLVYSITKKKVHMEIRPYAIRIRIAANVTGAGCVKISYRIDAA